MSGQTVTGNALQFTNDNKYCWAYSGTVLVGTVATNVSTFQTQSEYLVGDVSIFVISDTTDNIEFIVKFNDVTILETTTTSYVDYAPFTPIPLIVPPFTVVKLEAFNLATGSKNVAINFTGKVGMAPRVGNLDE